MESAFVLEHIGPDCERRPAWERAVIESVFLWDLHEEGRMLNHLLLRTVIHVAPSQQAVRKGRIFLYV